MTFALNTTATTTPDFEAAISTHLYSVIDGAYTQFEDNHELPNPLTCEMGDRIHEHIEDAREYAFEGATFSLEAVVESVLEDSDIEDAADIVTRLQDDMHEMFPNEKLWGHLDAMCERAGKEYYADLHDQLYAEAERAYDDMY